ncbi:response regulator [Candidatus Poribacteria bacterium]|nr:response regulator [Candidatus Poribacteria bacterium]
MANILLVEDNPDHIILIEMALKKSDAKFEVEVAVSGSECLEKFSQESYDVVLLDYSLPKMSGLEVLEKIHQLTSDIPVVMITGQGDENIAVEAMKKGAYDYVTKSGDFWIRLPTVIQQAIEKDKMIAEKELLKKQLIQSQRMEGVGALAAGIAHDFNNLLTGVLGYASLMKLQIDTENKFYDYVDGIEKAALKCAELTQRLRSISRQTVFQKQPLCFNDTIDDVVQLLERTINKNISIKTDLKSDLKAVDADSSQMYQVILNISINARDAMPLGGELTITSENIILDEEFCRSKINAHPGEYVKISIADTGVGIDKKHIDRIFEPFFSTKGVGSGLGLSIVYNVLQNHDGLIEVESELGKGTIFKIYLPASHQVLAPKEAQILLKGTEVILIVDDEAVVRDTISLMLKNLGYQVYLASSGMEALEMYQRHKDEIDLIILDIIMPQMDGQQTYVQLKQINPDLKVIVCSGYSQHDIINKMLSDEGVVGFMRKPPQMAQLSQVVRKALDTPKTERKHEGS